MKYRVAAEFTNRPSSAAAVDEVTYDSSDEASAAIKKYLTNPIVMERPTFIYLHAYEPAQGEELELTTLDKEARRAA